jgi:carboxyl-terminal processing protease
MPDSLRRAFKTKDGRIVYDGKGIKPDIDVKHGKYSDVVISLLQKRLIFDFANNYRNNHDSIPAAADFKLSDAVWQDFLAFLKDKNYEYKTDTEEQLEQLASTAKDENYYDAIATDFNDMENKLKAEKHEDVNKYKTDIKNILQEEIAARYYYQDGRIEASFDHDPDVQQALKVLANPKEYNKILGK